MRHLPLVFIVAAMAVVPACVTDEPPAWLLECEATPAGDPRGNLCKEACGAAELCPGASQPLCELECRACSPDAAWCPADPAVPQ